MSFLRTHRYSVLLAALSLVAGLVLGVMLLPGDWALARRLAAGLVGGAGVGLMLTATRIIHS